MSEEGKMEWQPIDALKPECRDGRIVEIGWICNGEVELAEFAVWSKARGGFTNRKNPAGHYTPTHWRLTGATP